MRMIITMVDRMVMTATAYAGASVGPVVGSSSSPESVGGSMLGPEGERWEGGLLEMDYRSTQGAVS